MMKSGITIATLLFGLIIAGCGDGTDTSSDSQADSAQADAGDLPDATIPTMVDGAQEITVQVFDTGYVPSRIALKANVPARITFDQHGTTECAWAVKSPDLGIALTDLPENKQTVVEFTPSKEGTFEFTCGMDMLRGSMMIVSGESMNRMMQNAGNHMDGSHMNDGDHMDGNHMNDGDHMDGNHMNDGDHMMDSGSTMHRHS